MKERREKPEPQTSHEDSSGQHGAARRFWHGLGPAFLMQWHCNSCSPPSEICQKFCQHADISARRSAAARSREHCRGCATARRKRAELEWKSQTPRTLWEPTPAHLTKVEISNPNVLMKLRHHNAQPELQFSSIFSVSSLCPPQHLWGRGCPVRAGLVLRQINRQGGSPCWTQDLTFPFRKSFCCYGDDGIILSQSDLH